MQACWPHWPSPAPGGLAGPGVTYSPSSSVTFTGSRPLRRTREAWPARGGALPSLHLCPPATTWVLLGAWTPPAHRELASRLGTTESNSTEKSARPVSGPSHPHSAECCQGAVPTPSPPDPLNPSLLQYARPPRPGAAWACVLPRSPCVTPPPGPSSRQAPPGHQPGFRMCPPQVPAHKRILDRLLQTTVNSWLGQRRSCSPSPGGGARAALVHKEVTAAATVFRPHHSPGTPRLGHGGRS